MKTGIKTRRIAIKMKDEPEFQAKGVGKILNQLYANDGRLSDQEALARVWVNSEI